tara:strand:+ start:1375 stop:1929 length:555 start_codon:yes stop_codon:yes gene_type:complete
MNKTDLEKEAEFRERWSKSHPSKRFEYELNRELLLVLFFFVTAMVGMGAVLGSILDMAWLGWTIIGLLSMVLVIGAAFLIFVWHTYARRSAVLVDNDALVWLYVGEVRSLAWTLIDREVIGNALENSKETKGILGFQVGEERKELLAYNPHMRIKNFPILMAEILQRLQQEQNTNGKPGEEGSE